MADISTAPISTLKVGDKFVDGGRIFEVKEVREDGMRISAFVELAKADTTEIAKLSNTFDAEVNATSEPAQSAPKRRTRSK